MKVGEPVVEGEHDRPLRQRGAAVERGSKGRRGQRAETTGRQALELSGESVRADRQPVRGLGPVGYLVIHQDRDPVHKRLCGTRRHLGRRLAGVSQGAHRSPRLSCARRVPARGSRRSTDRALPTP